MAVDPVPDAPSEQPAAPRGRRPRYRGTHPRRYAERYKELNADAHPGIVAHLRDQGRTPAGTHVPVLLEEVLAALRPAPGSVVADCTLGYGGHAAAFMEHIGPTGVLHGFDVDRNELDRTGRRLRTQGVEIHLHRRNFAGLGTPLRERRLQGYDIIFADLGLSSMQVDDPARGFSFKQDGPLDMRMDDRLRRTAEELLMSISEDALAAALRELADEPRHAEIARALVAARARRPIRRTLELAQLVLGVVGKSQGGCGAVERSPHPAARTFQTLRMLVNDELGSLRALLRDAPYCLNLGGRIGVISFHSGEDRLVKHALRDGLRSGVYSEISPECIRPGPAERRDNPRCASAKLRWATRAADDPHR